MGLPGTLLLGDLLQLLVLELHLVSTEAQPCPSACPLRPWPLPPFLWTLSDTVPCIHWPEPAFQGPLSSALVLSPDPVACWAPFLL